MKFLVLGAGIQGTAVAFDLARATTNIDQCAITLADMDLQAAQQAVARIKAYCSESEITAVETDVSDASAAEKLMLHHDAVISAVPYRFNADLAAAAVNAKAHFFDLGGNNDIVDREFELDALARKNDVLVIPDCGLAPGVVSVIAALASEQLAETHSIQIRVGGIPVKPKPPLNYQISFSVSGLINEYIEPARVLRDGRELMVSSLTELEEIEFPEPFGDMEAFQTSGGCSTLTRTMARKVKNLDYKTIRWPGHCEQIRLLHELGFFSDKAVNIQGKTVCPRDLSEHILQSRLFFDEEDVILLRVSARGIRDGRTCTISYQAIEYADKEHRFSAMARMTAYPASIIALMAVNNDIAARGAIPQELCVPGELMLKELEKRNIHIHRHLS